MGRSTHIRSICLLLIYSHVISVEAARLPKVPLSKLYNLTPGTSPHFPQGQAERLIRSLGLLPGAAEESYGSVNGPGLHEKRVHLKVGDGSAPAAGTHDAEHYAGYFNLKRIRAAK